MGRHPGSSAKSVSSAMESLPPLTPTRIGTPESSRGMVDGSGTGGAMGMLSAFMGCLAGGGKEPQFRMA